jgi:hypothetical protein
MRLVWFIFLCLCLGSIRTSAQNKVLSLDGLGAHVGLPDGLFDYLEEGTVEVWVNWAALGNYSPVLTLGERKHSMGFNQFQESSDLQFYIYSSPEDIQIIRVGGIIKTRRWMHLAGVFGPTGMKLYINGTLVGENDYVGGFGLFDEESPSNLGLPSYAQNSPFRGMIDGVRIWDHSREQTEILSDMASGLRVDQEGLIGSWIFDAGDASDGTRYKRDGELLEDALCMDAEFPDLAAIQKPTLVSGVVLDQSGNPALGATVRVYQNSQDVSGDDTGVGVNAAGHFEFWCSLSDGTYDVHASYGDQSDWLADVTIGRLARPAKLRLGSVGRISGTLRALDDTGHPFHLVQAVRNDVVIDTAFADMRGRYTLIDLPPGSYRLRRESSNGFSHFESESAETTEFGQDEEGDLLEFGVGETRTGMDFRFAPYRKGHWTRFSDFETGLAMGRISNISPVNDGSLWFLSGVAGVCRFDAGSFRVLRRRTGCLPSGSWPCTSIRPESREWGPRQG